MLSAELTAPPAGRVRALIRRVRSPGSALPGLAPPWTLVMIFVLPALVIYAGFTGYPILRTAWNSVHLILPNQDGEFVGGVHYRAILSDDIFWRAVRNTLLWALVSPVMDVGIGLLLALCLYTKVRGSRFFRVVWFTPVLLSYVVVAILWRWIYNYDWGVVNTLLRGVGLEAWVRPWLGDPATALPALMLAHVWKWAGFNMVVCLAALHALPSEVLEAADLDNCGPWAKLRHVIVPMLRPTLLSLLILSFIGKMKVFDLVWIMTRGGPLWSTETVATYTYKRAFDWNTFDLGYPSAIAVVWFVVVMGASVTLTALFRQRGKLEY